MSTSSSNNNSELVKSWELITNNSMTTIILYGLIFAGIFIKIFLTNSDGSSYNGAASSTIWGYGLATVSLFTLMFVVLSKDLNAGESAFQLIIKRGFPILALVLILIYIITLNFNYFKIINQNFVPQEFNLYSLVSTILIVFQIVILFQFTNLLLQKQNKNINMESRIINITWIFSVLNLLLGIIMNIILEFFTTDG